MSRKLNLQSRACTSYRIVDNGSDGILYASELREDADKWVKRFCEHGKDVRLEKWEGTYLISPTTWVQVTDPDSSGSPAEGGEVT